MYKYIIFILFIIITFVFICKLLLIEKFSNFNCDLIPNSDTCTIKIKGDDGEKGEKGSEGYKGTKGAKGKNGLSGSMGINGKEIPNIKFKELNKEESLLGNYYSYDSNADTKTIYLNRGSKGIRAIIPPLKLIYNDSSNDITINETEENSGMEPIIINLKNVKGRKGDRGIDGQCSEGERGIKGDQGREGHTGPPGEDGLDGPQGPNGDDGPIQRNVEYNSVSSKTYCFNKGGSEPLCISKNSYQDYYDSIQTIDNYTFVPTEVVKTGSTRLNDEPSEDSPLNKQCIECPCGQINNGSGECVDDDTQLVIFNNNNECKSFSGDLNLTKYGDKWNDKVTKIHIPPGVKITAHKHNHIKHEHCKEYNNTGNEIMKQNLEKGIISFIGYDKTCADYPPPPPPPPPDPPAGEDIEWGDYEDESFEYGGWMQNAWRDYAWQVVRENGEGGREYVMIIHNKSLMYAGYGDKDGATESVIVTNKIDNNIVREYVRTDPADVFDDINLSYVDDRKSDRWFNGPFFINDSYNHWTQNGQAYSFKYRTGKKK